MRKKAQPQKAGTIEDRLFGIETRLGRIENHITDDDFTAMRYASKITDFEKSMVRLEDRIEKFHEKLLAEFTKFRSEIHTMIDPLVKIAETKEEEQIIHKNQHDELYDDVETLKKIHPKNSHTPVVA